MMRMKMWILLLGLVVTSVAAGPGTCVGRCGEVFTRDQQCTCDFSCLQHNECCQDFERTCTTAQSCLGRCGETFRRGQPCDCDPQCISYNTCCHDYQLHCDGSMSVAHPRTSQHLRAASSGNHKSQRSKKRSNSESEEWYTGLHRPLTASSSGPARPAVSSNQQQHGVSGASAVSLLPASIPSSLRGPSDSLAPSPSLLSYSAPSLGNGAPESSRAPYGSNQGLSSLVGSRPRPSTLHDVAQALGLSVGEGGSEGTGLFADVDLCSDFPINGLTALSNGTILIFKGQLFWSVDPVTRSFARPQRITDTLGVSAPIDTVFTRCNCQKHTYIIKGDQYWRLDENMVIEPGFPKPLASEFPGLTGTISAALAVPATRSTLETVYFFKNGDIIQRFTFSPGSTPSCSPKPRTSSMTRLARHADAHLSGEINIKVSLKGFPTPVTSALSMPSPLRSDRYHHHVFSGPLFFHVQIVEEWPAQAKPDPSSALVPLPMLSSAAIATNAANEATHNVNPLHPPNSIRVWLRCP